ncbi:DUF3515 domain-containing protein [soil metagenome]
MPRLPLLAVPALLLVITACSPTVAMEPAAQATDPGCAEVIVRLTTVNDLPQRETNAQATAAWGDPTSVLLRCGVAQPAPSTQCNSFDGVDWITDDSNDPRYVFTTYGRDPAVQVVIDTDLVNGEAKVLTDLANAVGSIPQTKECTDPDDTPQLSPH